MSAARSVASGSFVFACPANGAIVRISTPTDNKGNTYTALGAAHAYVNWSGSGAQLFAASNVVGDSALVVSESTTDPDDEVTLSVIEVRGGTSITNYGVADVPGGGLGPATSPGATVASPAVLVSWWWGDGATVQPDVQPSAGWTRAHALNFADAATGVVQPACAYRLVSAGTHAGCTWTASDGQGGFAMIVAVEQ